MEDKDFEGVIVEDSEVAPERYTTEEGLWRKNCSYIQAVETLSIHSL
jgi:hypothetical protein